MAVVSVAGEWIQGTGADFRQTAQREGDSEPGQLNLMSQRRHARKIPTGRLLYVPTRARWRAWLKKHYRSETEVWLVFPRAGSGKPRVPYNDAVEEALCFGWIDSTVHRIDDASFAQRFSVRRAGSKYSQANLERLRFLVGAGKVAGDIRRTLPDLSPGRLEVPKDIAAAIRANPRAWKNFRTLSESYIRIRIAYIEGARRRPAEFRKRLAHFIRMTELNKRIGFGGIDKHY